MMLITMAMMMMMMMMMTMMMMMMMTMMMMAMMVMMTCMGVSCAPLVITGILCAQARSSALLLDCRRSHDLVAKADTAHPQLFAVRLLLSLWVGFSEC